ncbi:ABC transporter permease [Streptococcus cameli]
MKKFILQKTLRLIVSLLVFSFLLHVLLRFSVGDPALGFLRRAGVESSSQQQLAEVRQLLGLEGNLFETYIVWLKSALMGDFGVSFVHKKPALLLFGERFLTSLGIILPAYLVNILLSLVLGGMLANVKKEKNFSFLSSFFTILVSTPVYCSSFLLIYLFGIQFQFLPFVGSQTPLHFILPVMCLVISEGAYLSKMSMDLFYENKQSERQLMARFRKMKWYYIWLYQIRELLIPLVTLWVQAFQHLFGMILLIESIFSIFGVGQLLLESILSRDYPVIQCITCLLACLTFLLYYSLDVLLQVIDNRICLIKGEENEVF